MVRPMIRAIRAFYKNKPVAKIDVADNLASQCAEGGVRKAGNRLRIARN